MSKLLSFAAWFMSIDWGKVASFFFVDKYGEFQWVGVTAVVALVAFIFNQVWERRKLRADVKYKSSIEWISKYRDLVADFIAATEDIQLKKIAQMAALHKKSAETEKLELLAKDSTETANLELLAKKSTERTKRELLRNEYNNSRISLQKAYQLLILYTPESEDTPPDKSVIQYHLLDHIKVVLRHTTDNVNLFDMLNSPFK